MERKNVFLFSAIFLFTVVAIVISEFAIRVFNIPGIDKNIHYTIDPLVGYGDVPHAELVYCKNRKGIIQRKFNSFGYLDTEHKKEKKHIE